MRVRRITTGPKAVARAVKKIVLADEHYYQGSWFSRKFFPNKTGEYDFTPVATGSQFREIAGKNVCGSTACVAGSVVVLTLPPKAKYSYNTDTVLFEDGTEQGVESYAGGELGLCADEAEWLFSSGRSVDNVLRALDLIIKGKSLDELMDRW